MSGESALRATPSVNIEEFERRLRATGSLGAPHDDPLAELARLLGAEEPAPAPPVEAPAASSEPDPEPAPPPAAAPPPLRAAPRVENASGRVVNVDFGGPAPAPEPPPLVVEPPPFVETPAEPPPLRRAPSAARLADEASPRSKVWPVAALVVIGVAAGAGAWAYRGGVPGLVAKAPPLIMAAAGPTKVQPPSQDTVSSPNDIASMIAKDQTSRPTTGNVVSSEEQPVDLNERAKAQAAADARAAAPPASPPTIAAAPLVVVSAPSPTAPSAPAPTPASDNAAAASAPILAVSAQSAPAPAASTNPPAPASSAPPSRSLASAAASPSPAAAADPTSITPGGGTVGPTAAPPAPPTPFPEPKRVKTVSVRPDGSFIAAPPQQDQTAGASEALEPPTLPVDPPIPVPRPAIDPSSAEPATPKLDLPTKLSGKTTTRVPIAKIDTTAATTGQSPEAPLPVAQAAQEAKPKRHEPVRIAAAEPPVPDPGPAASAAEAAPSQEEKPSGAAGIFAALGDAARGLTGGGQQASAPAAPPVRTASAAPQATAPTPVEGGGNYAVQLAAPGSEAEAHSIASRLESKYAAELGGLQPSIHKASLKDKTVYRVRVQRLTRSAAVSLCEKLKAAGGACFLARE